MERIRPDYLDELLFAKFAELDHNVAILREEMDRIAQLLERRKRAADEARINFHPADDLRYAGSSPCFSQETMPQSLDVNSYTIPSIENHLYGSKLAVECNQVLNRNGRKKHTSELAFHPYGRLTELITPAGERTEQTPTTRTFDNVMDILNSSAMFILSKKSYPLLTTAVKPEHYDEELPSDPDDNVVDDAHDQIQAK
ncbi:unnamed protein product [Cylicocyclus nassatus]|uniref:Uncharacterized protein n=1 Tax=Cylicocyclus nassatus TaxID=53992 RepID=A0AA36M645_CYLNA|nr:unnamed protein product [Cylicocyclus nassatus]